MSLRSVCPPKEHVTADRDGVGEGHRAKSDHCRADPVSFESTDDLVSQLCTLKRRINQFRRAQDAVYNQALASVRVPAGWQWYQEGGTRKGYNKLARGVVAYVWHRKPLEKTIRDEDGHCYQWARDLATDLVPYIEPDLLYWYELYSLSDRRRRDLEKELVKLAEHLPIASYVNSLPTVTPLTVGKIVGETGDFNNYKSWKLVAKRMGCAPYHGKMPSTWRRKPHKSRIKDDEWPNVGYHGRRHAILRAWSTSAVMSEWNPWKDVYYRWKEYEADRADDNAPQSAGQLNDRAHAIIQRRLLKMLFLAWRQGVELNVEDT